jgi:hypothetical protein
MSPHLAIFASKVRPGDFQAKEKPAESAGFSGSYLVDQMLKDWNQTVLHLHSALDRRPNGHDAAQNISESALG